MKRIVAALALTLALIGCSGCSSKSTPIIEVGSQVVTVADYERVGLGAEHQYPGSPEDAKADFINDLQRGALLLEQAHRLGHDTSTALANATRDHERELLLNALYAKLAPQAQPVSEAELRALYEARKQEAHVWLIYASSHASALAAQERLKAGEPFEAVSRSFSLLGVLPPNGDMGFIVPGTLPDPLDSALRKLPLHEAGGPYHSREGWFVMRVTERRPREQGPFESMRAGLEQLARQRKQRSTFTRAYESLKADFEVALAPGGPQLMFRAMSPVDPLAPTAEMRATPLATYRGGVFTLEDAFNDLKNAEVQAPPWQLLPAIEIWIEGRVMGRVALLEARRRHIHEEPAVATQLRARRDQMLLEGVYAVAVSNVPPPGPEQVAMAWERLKPQFTRLERVRVAEFVTPDSTLIMRVAREGGLRGPLAAAVQKADPAQSVTETEVLYPSDDPAWAGLQGMFQQQQPGVWFGPEKTATGWRILQLVDKTMAQQQFEELPASVQQSIAGSASEIVRDTRFKQYTDSLAAAFKPRQNQAVIAKLPWPMRPRELAAR